MGCRGNPGSTVGADLRKRGAALLAELSPSAIIVTAFTALHWSPRKRGITVIRSVVPQANGNKALLQFQALDPDRRRSPLRAPRNSRAQEVHRGMILDRFPRGAAGRHRFAERPVRVIPRHVVGRIRRPECGHDLPSGLGQDRAKRSRSDMKIRMHRTPPGFRIARYCPIRKTRSSAALEILRRHLSHFSRQ
jgi:hypothetical protein